MDLSPKQVRALEAICDTFAPGADGTPSATAMGVPPVLWDAVAMNPREADRKQVAQLLSLWDTRLLTAIGGGGLSRFSELSPERRERVLLSWCDSRLPQRRAAFQALRKAALLFYYMVPGTNGDRSPVWDRIGYPGPLGKNPDAPPKALQPLAIDRDTDLECDVCVVGSGAGGGTAAGVLAAAGSTSSPPIRATSHTGPAAEAASSSCATRTRADGIPAIARTARSTSWAAPAWVALPRRPRATRAARRGRCATSRCATHPRSQPRRA